MSSTKLPTKVVCCLGLAILAGPALADEGGVSFWLPGQLGSLAAVPGEPGWRRAGATCFGCETPAALVYPGYGRARGALDNPTVRWLAMNRSGAHGNAWSGVRPRWQHSPPH